MLALRTMKMVHHDPSVSRLRENTQASAEAHLGTPRCLLNIMDATFAWIIFQTCYFGKFWHSKMHHFRSPTRPHRQALTYEVWKKNGDVLLPGQTVTLEDFPLSFRRKKVRFCWSQSTRESPVLKRKNVANESYFTESRVLFWVQFFSWKNFLKNPQVSSW